MLKEKGGEATTREMADSMDESCKVINLLAYNLRRRGKIEIVHNKISSKKPPFHMNTFKIKPLRKKWQLEQKS